MKQVFAAGKLDSKSWTITTCFVDGIGPNNSTANFWQHCFGTAYGFTGSLVFLSVKIQQSLNFLNKLFDFCIHVIEQKIVPNSPLQPSLANGELPYVPIQ